MTDEEKEAIEYIKNCLDNEYNFKNATRQKDKKAYNIILNLIEKQSKEIEELKEDKYGLEEEVQIQAKNIMLYENTLCEIQDKIKAKIEEFEKQQKEEPDAYLCIKVLQSLLEKE